MKRKQHEQFESDLNPPDLKTPAENVSDLDLFGYKSMESLRLPGKLQSPFH